MNEKIIALVTALYNKSLSKMVVWDKTNSDSEFIVTLESGVTVTIDSFSTDGRKLIDIGINNNKGEKIFYFATSRNDSVLYYNLLQNLYNSARDVYYKVDETIDDILSEIDTKPIIGENSNNGTGFSYGEEDELPF